jgi:hypothetical protein
MSVQAIAEILYFVATQETAIEEHRKSLVQLPTFSPSALFNQITKSCAGLKPTDIYEFLGHMNVYCSAHEAMLIIE